MWSLTRRPLRRPTAFSRPGALRTPSVHAQPRLSTALLHTSSTMRVGREHINLTPKDTFNWRKVRGEVMEPLRRPAPNLGSQNVTYIPETHPDEAVLIPNEKLDPEVYPIAFFTEEKRKASYTEPLPREQKRSNTGRATAVGRRKTATATVALIPNGSGKITINGRHWMYYFKHWTSRNEVLLPLTITERLHDFDVEIKVSGGGFSGQAGAIRLAITRALLNYDPELYPPLRAAGFLTRDPRVVERKKTGKRKARREFQWVKR